MAVAHDIPLIATLATGLGLAFVAGFVASKLRLPPLVGYLVAGLAVGPNTPGVVVDASIARQLSEIGVILLMFGVGTHFSLKDLWNVRRIALPGAIVQIVAATLLGLGVAVYWWTWSVGQGLIFGLALSTASTVVLLRALQERGLLDSLNGRIAVGWLVVEDLAMVFTLIVLPAVAGALGGVAADHGSLSAALGITALKIGFFFALIYVIGLRLFPWLFGELARSGSRELVTLFVTVLAISVAFAAAKMFDVSFALGAFVAGVVVNEAGLGKRIHAQIEVLEHVFTVLFFVAVGMLFDPTILLREPFKVLMVLSIVMIGKSVAAFGIVMLLRYPLGTALTVSASLAQIGEFSFILAALGLSLNLLPQDGYDLILAGALLSIALNPLVFRIAIRAGRRFARHLKVEEPIAVPSRGHVVLIGHGRVGRSVAKALAQAHLPFIVVEQSRDVVERLRKRGWRVVAGDATHALVLRQAELERAELAVIATPNADEARGIFERLKEARPSLPIVVRTHSDEEMEHFQRQGAALALMAEKQLALAMSQYVIARYKAAS